MAPDRRERTAGHTGRRAVLKGACGLLLPAAATACSGGTAGPSPSGPSTAPGTITPSRPAGSPTSPPLPRTRPWRPSPGDVRPEVKRRAVQVVEAIGTVPAGQSGAAAARRRVAALGLDPRLVDQAGPLLPDGSEAVLDIIDVQYGGLLADSASVLVVCAQSVRRADGSLAAGGTTVDVRLRRSQPRWTVTALHPARPAAAAAGLTSLARQVLADSRIGLPPASAADIRSGTVHASVLTAMLRLARNHRMDVSVVRSGHPLRVFGTTRPSDHPLGRAFDVWRIDGHSVVDPATPRSLTEAFMREAAAAGSYNVGGPSRPAGGTGDQFFADDTHRDHIHMGFTT